MSVRTKVVIAFAGLFVLYVAVAFAVQWEFSYSEFERLERQMAARNLDRWEKAIERELDHLSNFAGDWTDWDDAYEFVQSGDPEFIESNLAADSWFQNFDLPVLCFYDTEGKQIWGRNVDPATGKPIELKGVANEVLQPLGPLLVGAHQREARGLLASDRGPMLVVARSVVRTDGSGPPVGQALFARLLDGAKLARIERQTSSDGELAIRGAGSDVSPAVAQELARSAPGLAVVNTENREFATAAVLLRDIRGEPSLALTVRTPRAISASGRAALWLSVLILGGAGVAGLGVQLLVLQKVVLGPLTRLCSHADGVGRSDDLTMRLNLRGRDEIGALGRAFDRMVEQMSVSRSDLVERSRAAGQSETASSVAHNLGNVLNGSVVSLSSISDRLAGMRLAGLRQLAEMVEENADRLPQFLAEAGRGAQLPEYLHALADALDKDRAAIAGDAARLREQLQRMDEIASAQSELTPPTSYSEFVSVSACVQRALAIVGPSLERHGIQVDCRLGDGPPCGTDPVKVLQILVNVLTNAKDAVLASPVGVRRIGIDTEHGADAVRIRVRDTGKGIERRRLEEIFRAGYSTKHRSQGIGLHYCALAAQQLGGSLRAESEGAGRGACFTLEIPRRSTPERAAA